MPQPQSDPRADDRGTGDAGKSAERSAEPGGGSSAVTVRSEDLFHGAREVLIEHSGEVYRLRLTRNGKLILHK